MANLEKLGVILMLLGLASFRDGGVAGLFGTLLFGCGVVAFFFGGESHLTQRATDLCQECGVERIAGEDKCSVCGTSR